MEMPQSMNKKKVLLVDDDPLILKTMSIKLKARGYDVLTASDGSSAVTTVRTMKPDLIVLDISFPPDFGNVDWDGFRILEWFKRLEETMNTPTIVVTGGDPAKYAARAMQLGAAAFFRKPFDHDLFFESVRKILANEIVTA